jgi:hypothetical protein
MRVPRGPGGRRADGQVLAQLLGRLAVGASLDQDGLVAQFRRAVPQGRQHQVRPAPVHWPAAQRRPRLDDQHRLILRVEKMRPELVREQPAPVHP